MPLLSENYRINLIIKLISWYCCQWYSLRAIAVKEKMSCTLNIVLIFVTNFLSHISDEKPPRSEMLIILKMVRVIINNSAVFNLIWGSLIFIIMCMIYFYLFINITKYLKILKIMVAKYCTNSDNCQGIRNHINGAILKKWIIQD